MSEPQRDKNKGNAGLAPHKASDPNKARTGPDGNIILNLYMAARFLDIKVLRPAQSNRAYDILAKKFRRSPAGETKGWGLEVFP